VRGHGAHSGVYGAGGVANADVVEEDDGTTALNAWMSAGSQWSIAPRK
jgi:hypothetical protein